MNEEIIKEAMTPYIVKILSKVVSPAAKIIKKRETYKYLLDAKKAYKAKGAGAALDELSKTKDIVHNLKKLPKQYKLDPSMVEGTGTAAGRFLRESIGNSASTARILTKGVRQSGWRAPLTVSKNLATLLGRDLRSSGYKSMTSGKHLIFNRKVDFKKLNIGDTYGGPIFKKTIVGKSPEGNLIVRKSAIGRVGSAAMTGSAFGAYAFKGTKDKPFAERAAKGVGEAAMWTVAPTAGMIGLGVKDYLKQKKILKKRQFSGGQLNGIY